MRRRHPWLSTASRFVMLSILLLTPTIASASHSEEDPPDIIDGRLEGYTTGGPLPESSTGGTWVLFVVLGVFTAGGLFKDAKRSHLD